jgi:hypothetical protein
VNITREEDYSMEIKLINSETSHKLKHLKKSNVPKMKLLHTLGNGIKIGLGPLKAE